MTEKKEESMELEMKADALVGKGMKLMRNCPEHEDLVDALACFDEAARLGDPYAEYYAGTMYMDGIGTEPDYEKGISLVRKAAENGYINAQYEYGYRRYVNNTDDDFQEDSEAFEWMEKAARQGHCDAQYHCGMMYLNGEGKEADEEKANVWMKRAAANGHGRAKANLDYLDSVKVGTEESLDRDCNMYPRARNHWRDLCFPTASKIKG